MKLTPTLYPRPSPAPINPEEVATIEGNHVIENKRFDKTTTPPPPPTKQQKTTAAAKRSLPRFMQETLRGPFFTSRHY